LGRIDSEFDASSSRGSLDRKRRAALADQIVKGCRSKDSLVASHTAVEFHVYQCPAEGDNDAV
jgi:hypothetical protein